MRISELAQRAELPVATVKFYLRERLVPPGRATSATQADYDDGHLARLRLVRALVRVAGLSVASTRSVLDVIDHRPSDVAAAVATAHEALGPAPGRNAVVDPATVQEAIHLVQELGWTAAPESTSVQQLALALVAARAAGLPLGAQSLGVYADAALAVARHEVASVPTGSPDAAAAYVVLGTVLYEPVLLALRRIAQQHAFATTDPASDVPPGTTQGPAEATASPARTPQGAAQTTASP